MRLVLRILPPLLAGSFLCLAAGCASRTPPPAAPLVVTVPHVERLDVSAFGDDSRAINRVLSARAESYATDIGGKNVWYGDGLSMEPLITPGSWVVTRSCDFSDLQPGMIVLYTTTSGRPVAHALVRRTARGWLAAGVNNAHLDPEFVTSANLAGVIAAVFTPENTRHIP